MSADHTSGPDCIDCHSQENYTGYCSLMLHSEAQVVGIPGIQEAAWMAVGIGMAFL